MTHLTQVRIATYNVSSDGATVYYQVDNGKDNGLYVLDTKSGVQTELRSGNYNYYHIIDNYLFFEEFDGSAAYVMNLSNEQIEDFQSKQYRIVSRIFSPLKLLLHFQHTAAIQGIFFIWCNFTHRLQHKHPICHFNMRSRQTLCMNDLLII